MNFKKYYINGHRWSIYITYRNVSYNIEIEHWWNNFMYILTLFTTLRYIIVEDSGYFLIVEKYLIWDNLISVYDERKETEEKLKQLNDELYKIKENHRDCIIWYRRNLHFFCRMKFKNNWDNY